MAESERMTAPSDPGQDVLARALCHWADAGTRKGPDAADRRLASTIYTAAERIAEERDREIKGVLDVVMRRIGMVTTEGDDRPCDVDERAARIADERLVVAGLREEVEKLQDVGIHLVCFASRHGMEEAEIEDLLDKLGTEKVAESRPPERPVVRPCRYEIPESVGGETVQCALQEGHAGDHKLPWDLRDEPAPTTVPLAGPCEYCGALQGMPHAYECRTNVLRARQPASVAAGAGEPSLKCTALGCNNVATYRLRLDRTDTFGSPKRAYCLSCGIKKSGLEPVNAADAVLPKRVVEEALREYFTDKAGVDRAEDTWLWRRLNLTSEEGR